jgi:hypothetical protein
LLDDNPAEHDLFSRPARLGKELWVAEDDLFLLRGSKCDVH